MSAYQSSIDAVRSHLRAVQQQLDSMEAVASSDVVVTPARRRALIARAVVEAARLVGEGVPEDDALALASASVGADALDLHFAWSRSDRKRRAMDLYARRWCAQRMLDAGFSSSDVARVLGCHPKHVSRLVRPLR